MDFKAMASSILSAVGGKENVSQVVHCATRLRFTLKDDTKADTDAIKKIKGVLSVVNAGGQYQVVIGNEVSNLFKEFKKLGNFSEEGGGAPVKAKGNPIQRLFGFVAGCLTPLLPAMLGTGMVKVAHTTPTLAGVLVGGERLAILPRPIQCRPAIIVGTDVGGLQLVGHAFISLAWEVYPIGDVLAVVDDHIGNGSNTILLECLD